MEIKRCTHLTSNRLNYDTEYNMLVSMDLRYEIEQMCTHPMYNLQIAVYLYGRA